MKILKIMAREEMNTFYFPLTSCRKMGWAGLLFCRSKVFKDPSGGR